MIPSKLFPIGSEILIDDDTPYQLKVLVTDDAKIFNWYANSNRYFIDWGDGSTYEGTDTTHTYEENGVYTISITLISFRSETTHKIRPFGNSAAMVVDCNWKWDSLGEVYDVNNAYQINADYAGKICQSVPSSVTTMDNFFAYQSNLPCKISSIPNDVHSLFSCRKFKFKSGISY